MIEKESDFLEGSGSRTVKEKKFLHSRGRKKGSAEGILGESVEGVVAPFRDPEEGEGNWK